MKRIFKWLLRYYSREEKGRLEIIEILVDSVNKEYYEQTIPGNFYNANIEFCMGNPQFRKWALNWAKEKDWVKSLWADACESAVIYIHEDEKRVYKNKSML